ncbi:MAG TPA: SPOR domain-containing protein [Methylophilus sp.]|nr:SPOR domain-containing protein [Methylophilus sp.]
MARDALTDNELLLKKTARRRLVGAITLVVLMLIVLPFVLKDRVIESSHDNVEITVVNRQANREPILELPDDEVVLDNEAAPATNTSENNASEVAEANIEEAPVSAPAVVATPQKQVKTEPAKPVVAPAPVKPVPTVEPKVAAVKPEAKEESIASDKKTGKFFVQFGVFSDPKNLETLQGKLKQAGFESATEKVDAAGQKLRLRTRTYATRNDAAAALKKLEAAGFSGIVANKS